MNTILRNHLSQIRLGTAQKAQNMTVFPLFIENPAQDPVYLTLTEALGRNLLTIREVDKQGHVPELKALNQADVPILILDGEELSGAKQNRVLNTSLLIKERTSTIIPVSCTEHGRWNFTTRRFNESRHISPHKIRAMKNKSVSDSLKQRRSFESNQAGVWDEIAHLHAMVGMHTQTGAMKDVMDNMKQQMDEYIAACPLLPEQRGIIVFFRNQAAGLDWISQGSAYALLHPKLVKSYAMDALFSPVSLSPPPTQSDLEDHAAQFISQLYDCEEHAHPSVGYGQDYRYEGQRITGSALIYRDVIIHTAILSTANLEEKQNEMASFQRRRQHRRPHSDNRENTSES